MFVMSYEGKLQERRGAHLVMDAPDSGRLDQNEYLAVNRNARRPIRLYGLVA